MAQFKVKDFYFKKAQKEGYRSRAAYKLKEIIEKKKPLKGIKKIVDLGCAPGGFLQILIKFASPKARIVGIDLKPVVPLGDDRVTLITGDATETCEQEKIKTELGGAAQLIVSDMAPYTTGAREVDADRSLELCITAFEISRQLLAEGGSLIMKIFESNEATEFRKTLKKHFSVVRATRPAATRKGSRELFIIAEGFKIKKDDDN